MSEDAIILGVKYPTDWHRVKLSQFLKPYRLNMSTVIIVPRSFLDTITSKIIEVGGTFKILKNEVTLVHETAIASLRTEDSDVVKIKNALREFDTLFSEFSVLLRKKKKLITNDYNDILKKVDLGVIDKALQVVGGDDSE